MSEYACELPTEEQLTRLEAVSQALNARSDAVRRIIKELDERLRAMRIGIRLWLPNRILDDGWFLGWDKRANWGVHVRGVLDNEATPLVEASRHVRLAALPWLSVLVQALIEAASKDVEELTAVPAQIANQPGNVTK